MGTDVATEIKVIRNGSDNKNIAGAIAKTGEINLIAMIFVSCALFSANSDAAETSYELRVGVSYSDNIGRVDVNEVDQTIATAGITVNVEGESRRSEGELSLVADYQKFLDNAFDSELLPDVEGILTLKPSPDRIHWVTEGRYGQARRNPFDASTPDNRETITTLSTGPDFILPVGSRTLMQLNSRYSTSIFEESDSDSDSLFGGLSVVRAISSNRSVSLNADGERVEYDSTGGLSGFERYSLYLGFDSEISRGTLSAKLGSNEVHADGLTFSGTLAELTWDRQISQISSFSISANQSYTDAGSFFGGLDSIFQFGRESLVVPVRDPFETQQIAATYSYVKGRVSFSVDISASEDEYNSGASLDNQRLRGSIRGRFDLRSGWSAAFSLAYEDRDFTVLDRTDEYLDATFSVDKRLSRTLSVGFEYRLDDRSSNADGQDYAENRYSILFRFSPYA